MNHSPLSWLESELAELEAAGLRRRRVRRTSPQGPEVEVDGQRLVNFASNDYLGLASDPEVVTAAREALERHGWGSGASPLVSGYTGEHEALEQELADFERQERAILFPTGFAANVATVAALVGEGDALYADANNHASLIDGSRLSKAARFVYRHNDVAQLAGLLKQGSAYRRRLIVTDSLFSMDGDFAPLVELGRLAEEYDAMLLADEAHATGVWGEEGRGVVEMLAREAPDLERQVTIRVGTLSKGLGSLGGFVAGSAMLTEWLAHNGRAYMFSTAAPAAVAAASRAALKIATTQSHRRANVQKLAAHLRSELSSRGWEMAGSESQIVPIVVGEADATMRLAEQLRAEGLFVPGIRPPTVAAGTSRLRISVTALHTEQHIERLLGALDRLR